MSDGHGGYRKPEKPAAVSGPGKYSQRTDGGPGKQPVREMTGGSYGEGKELADLQSAAPMSDTSGLPAPSGGMEFPGVDMSGITQLGADTERPYEPITSGADYGPGPGSATSWSPADDIMKLKKYLPLIQPLADQEDVPDSVRALYQFIRDV